MYRVDRSVLRVHTSKVLWVPLSNQNGFMKVDWDGRTRLPIPPPQEEPANLYTNL